MINARTIIDSLADASLFARDLVHALRLLHRTYGALWRSGATTKVIDNAATKIDIFNNEEAEGITASHANDKITVVTSGLYSINGHISISASGGAGNVTCQAYRNGAVVGVATAKAWVGNGEYADLRVNTIGKLEAGDYIELYCLGGGGLTYDVGACSLILKRLS